MPLAALPLSLGLALTFLLGLALGAAVNWSAYTHAWRRRAISPWTAPHPDAPPRRIHDRIPLWGWVGLRREAPVHGPGFWRRPMAVELVMGVGMAALYWWEVDQQGLVAKQVGTLAGAAVPPGIALAPIWTTVAAFVSHALLITLMAAASLIDLDEKLVPDDITVTGTLLGLVLAAAMPWGLLPHVSQRLQPQPLCETVPIAAVAAPTAGAIYVEPATLEAPREWPATLNGPLGLAVGLGSFALWCFALTPRIWRGRRGARFALQIIAARVVRELRRPPLAWIGLAGLAAIAAVWLHGGGAWIGLLSALVGMVGAGAMVWGVRIAGSFALRREAMGFGDVTFMMMVGAFVGWQAGIFIFFVAPLAGIVVGVMQLVLRYDDEIPYVPYLALATLAVVARWADFWNAQEAGPQYFFGVPGLVPVVLVICVIMLGAALVLWRNIKEAIVGRQ